MVFWVDKQSGEVVGQYRGPRCEKHHYDKKGKNKVMHKEEALHTLDAFLTLLSRATAYSGLNDEQREDIKTLRDFCKRQHDAIEKYPDEDALYTVDLLHMTGDLHSPIVSYTTPVVKLEDVFDRNYTVYRLYTYPTEEWVLNCNDYVWTSVCTQRCSKTAYRPVLLEFEPKLVSNKAKIDELAERNNQLTTYSCISCGYYFVISESEQAFFDAHQFRRPTHCRKCRNARRKQANDD